MQRLIDRAVDGAAIAAFAGMFACVLGQVGFRYFLGDPLVWSDELARYLFVWASFLGWIIAARRRSHLSIDMAAVRLPVFHIMAGPYSVDTAPVAGSTSTSVVASPEASLNST